MRRRVEEPGGVGPPAELTDYRLWCARRDAVPYGDADDEVSQRAAVVRWEAWCQERRVWAAEHGVGEFEFGGLDVAPWDPDAI